MPRTLRIGVDTGGTFTDLLAHFPDGRLRALKLPSTPADPAQAVLAGVSALLAGEPGPGIEPGAEIIHGTTVGTNTLLTRSGGPTALCVTAGFEDLLILGRQARPWIYALHPTVPPPLCQEEHCLGVAERLGPAGQVLHPLTPAALAELRERLSALGVASVAVVLLHSYCNDAHERAVGQALAPLGVPVSLSSVVLPAHREVERAHATVADAYIAPRVGGYLRRLQGALSAQAGGAPVRLRVMQSTGGAIAASEAAAAPVRTVLSGPAAGLIGAYTVAAERGVSRLITLDMGGTSTDVSLIDGEPALSTEMEIGGVPLHLPMLAVHTVGAGGGSLAWIDAGGALQVGPASAGASPGPACYGRGGTAPTLTDADLLLGRLAPAGLCDGALALDPAAAAAALQPLAERLGLSLREAAAGVVQVAGAVVARAVRSISVERGLDPGDFALFPFGGAGAVHAADLAQELGISRILLPPAPGLLSAYGALCARVVRERALTLLREASGAQQEGAVLAALRTLRAQVLADLEREGGQGQAQAQGKPAQLSWFADLRYHGQSYELTIPGIGDGGPAAGAETDLVVRFCEEHQRRYGFTLAERGVELVALRVRGVLPTPEAPPSLLQRLTRPQAPGVQSAQPVQPVQIAQVEMSFFEGDRLRTLPAPVLERSSLPVGGRVHGPALLVEYSATTVLPAGWSAVADEAGCLHLGI
jgi:N-methylhydantoinase A